LEAGGGSGFATLLVAGGGNSLSSAPMMKKKPPMPTAEMKSESLRPRDSTKKRTKMEVATTWGGARLVKVVKRWGRGEEAGGGRGWGRATAG
jgi:hypothetical protein